MDIALAIAIMCLALSIFFGKTLQIQVRHIHEVLTPPPEVIAETKEEIEDQKAVREMAKALQEITGVFQDDDK